MDSLHRVPLPASLSVLSHPELGAPLVGRFGEVAALKQAVAKPREEIASLKGLKGRPDIEPSGIDKGTGPAPPVYATPRFVRRGYAGRGAVDCAGHHPADGGKRKREIQPGDGRSGGEREGGAQSAA